METVHVNLGNRSYDIRFASEDADAFGEFAQYQLQPGIQEYVPVSQEIMRIERFVRQPDNSWLLTVFTDPDRPFALASVPATVPMADIYRDVPLTPQ